MSMSKGTYYNIEHGHITRVIEPIPKFSQEITDYFLGLLPLNSVHSVYIKGSRAYSEPADSDVDFTVVSDELPEETYLLEQLIYKKFNIELDCIISPKESFDEGFFTTCVYGDEDLSVTTIPITDIPPVSQSNLDSLINLHEWLEKCLKNKVYDALIQKNFKLYIKRCLRYTFLQTNQDVYTRDLYWCQKFIAKEFPQFAKITKQLVDIYLTVDHPLLVENQSLLSIPLQDSKILIEFLKDPKNVTDYTVALD